MTRPDYDGTRYGGQGGVLGAQQYADEAAEQPGAHAAEQPGQVPVPGQAFGAPVPGQPRHPGAQPGYQPYLPQGTYPVAAQQAPVGAAPHPAATGRPGTGIAQPGTGIAQPGTGIAQPGTASGYPAPAVGQPLLGSVSRPTGHAAATGAATALATSAATTLDTAAATGVAAAAPQGSRPGTVYGGHPPAGGDVRPTLSGRLARLRVGWHSVSLRALEQMGVSSPGTGLILGADVDQRPVPVRLFRPEPTRVTLVGGVWAAQMVAFRALALGASAVVMTGDPSAWHGFGERATGRPDRVTVIPGEQQVRTLGAAQTPMLVIHDLGLVGPTTSPELGPWQTQLTVLRQLDERGVPAVQEGHLVMMQRLSLREAALAATALRLTGESARLLQVMEDEMLALIGGGADRYVWISPTALEQRHAGAARR